MADITPPKETTNYKNFRPTTRFLRAKREKGGRLLSHTKKKKGKMTWILHGQFSPKIIDLRNKKKELFNDPCPTSDTKCCNQCLLGHQKLQTNTPILAMCSDGERIQPNTCTKWLKNKKKTQELGELHTYIDTYAEVARQTPQPFLRRLNES